MAGGIAEPRATANPRDVAGSEDWRDEPLSG
jgi:hypothetical protein